MPKTMSEMPFLDHLEELRWRILWSLLALIVCSAIGFFAVMRLNVMDILLGPLYSTLEEVTAADPSFRSSLVSGRLQFHNLTEPFFFIVKLSFLTGVVLASPIVVYQAWSFLAPALESRERRLIVPTMCFGLVLFAAGVSLAYFVALPITIRFLLEFGSEWFTPALTAGYYLPLVLRLLLAFGLVFELPVVVTALSSLGIVTPRFLRDKRRHAIVTITVVAALIALYEVSIVLSTVVHRRRDTPADDETGSSVPVLLVLGVATAGWKNRLRKTVAAGV